MARPLLGRRATTPKTDIAGVPFRRGTGYPAAFAAPSADRLRQRLGDAGGVTAFGVNLTRLPPGTWSAQRHWHSHEDEFVMVLEGEVVLIEDDGKTVLAAGTCAAFPKGTGNGHHLINRSQADAVYLEIGSRHRDDVTTCSDVDIMSANTDGRFKKEDGTPYPVG
ncbi:MAG: cupin domain-containing protein [Pseudomonadota bacterium]